MTAAPIRPLRPQGILLATDLSARADRAEGRAVERATSLGVKLHVVTVIEGKSTEVCLPERVDLLISEVVGSVASEEGLYATIADAHARHVKRPTDPRSWIPHRVQTLAAPCSYALHYALGLPAYDCMMRGASEPFLVREGPGQQPAFQPR